MSSPFPPRTQPGRQVNGRPTILTFLPSDEFCSSHWCTALIPLINHAIALSNPPYVSAERERLSGPSQYALELGDLESDGLPHASVFVLSFAEPREDDHYAHGVIATGAAKVAPYLEDSKIDGALTGINGHWLRPVGTRNRVPGHSDWEMKILATGSEYQRQGLAVYIMDVLYDEMRRRTAKADRVERGLEHPSWDTKDVIDGKLRRELYSENNTARPPKIRIVLSALYELLGKFYETRGYVIDANVVVDDERYGGTKPFHVCHMHRLLD